MKILIATVKTPFIRGGAEIHADALLHALTAAGHRAEMVQIPFKWYPPESILDTMLACRLLDLSESSGSKVDLLIGLKFPAYYMRHPNKVVWVLHQHRQAYDLWNHPEAGDLMHYPNGAEVRDAIMEADRKLLPEAKALYANSQNVADRLRRFCGLQAEPLYHPPPGADKLYCAEARDFLFLPSRLTPIKRQHLAIEALAATRNPVKLCLAGAPDFDSYLDTLKSAVKRLKLQDRVEFAGVISDEEKYRRYANCLAVVYPPTDEDYGYVTLEAMLASKPVITCSDSGGAAEFVGEATGFVTEPAATALAAAFDAVWENRGRSASMGRLGRDRYQSLGITWPHVVQRLLS